MARRSKRGSVSTGPVLKKLTEGRNGAIDVRRQAKIGSDEYKAAGIVTVAIDNLAEKLTGDRDTLLLKAHSIRNHQD
jgi:hypothetical protein